MRSSVCLWIIIEIIMKTKVQHSPIRPVPLGLMVRSSVHVFTETHTQRKLQHTALARVPFWCRLKLLDLIDLLVYKGSGSNLSVFGWYIITVLCHYEVFKKTKL